VLQPCSRSFLGIPAIGIVSNMTMTQNGSVNVTLNRTAYVVTGYKCTTTHGNKCVITIVDVSVMPVLLDCDTGFLP